MPSRVNIPDAQHPPVWVNMHMQMAFRDALALALKTKNITLAEMARRAGVSYDQYRNVIQGKARSTNVDDAAKVAAAFGVTLDDFLMGNLTSTQTITVAGRVGAGAKITLTDAYEKGAGPQVAHPGGLPPGKYVAVEVFGDSMEPVYSGGDLLFYTRETADGVPDDAIGRRCVCEDVNGMVWVKLIKRGSERGLFNLISFNPLAENQHDIVLKWAARVRLHWPADLVQSV